MSSVFTPLAASAAAIFITGVGLNVLPIAKIAPRLSESSTPLSPNTMSSVWAPSSTRLMTMSLCCATSAGQTQALAPAFCSAASGSARTS